MLPLAFLIEIYLPVEDSSSPSTPLQALRIRRYIQPMTGGGLCLDLDLTYVLAARILHQNFPPGRDSCAVFVISLRLLMTSRSGMYQRQLHPTPHWQFHPE